MKDTITLEKFNKVVGYKPTFIPTVWVEYMNIYGNTHTDTDVPLKLLWPLLCSIDISKLLNAGYSPTPEPVDWSKVEFGTKIKNKEINDCSIRKFLKFENGDIWYWNDTSNEIWRATSPNVTLAE